LIAQISHLSVKYTAGLSTNIHFKYWLPGFIGPGPSATLDKSTYSYLVVNFYYFLTINKDITRSHKICQVIFKFY